MKFSIVSPVYNAEKYINKCIQSILDQTYTNWELILIDDGSMDNSWGIIEKYMAQDGRIKGYQQDNAGPGVARNIGIKKTTGDYLVLVDSDDYIDKDYLMLLAPKAEKNDVVYIDVLQIDEVGKLICFEKISDYKDLTKDSLLRSQMTGKIMWGGVRKAVNLNLIRENNIKFSSLSIGEENLYSFRILYAAKSYGFIDEKPVYMYVNHLGSQSKLVDGDPYGGALKVLTEHIKDTGEYKIYANTLNAFNVVATVVSIDRLTQMYQGVDRRRKLKERLQAFMQVLDQDYPIDRENLVLKAKIFIPFLKIGWAWPVVLCSQLKIMAKR